MHWMTPSVNLVTPGSLVLPEMAHPYAACFSPFFPPPAAKKSEFSHLVPAGPL